jgi:hypothetical protein
MHRRSQSARFFSASVKKPANFGPHCEQMRFILSVPKLENAKPQKPAHQACDKQIANDLGSRLLTASQLAAQVEHFNIVII